MRGHKEVLTYKDIVLLDSDLDTLRGPRYLNDQIISFYLTYLLSSSTKTDDDEIMFVRPWISDWLVNSPDDEFVKEIAKEFAQSPKLSTKRLVLFVINGVYHWSIMVYDRTKNSFLHYDSIEGVHSYHAMKLYDAVKEYMGVGGEVSKPQPSSSSLKKHRNKKKKPVAKPTGGAKPESVRDTDTAGAVLPMFMECKTPQQSNGYDCGIYVLAIAKAVCQWWSLGDNKTDMPSVIEKNVDDSVEIKMRGEVLEIIHELTKD